MHASAIDNYRTVILQKYVKFSSIDTYKYFRNIKTIINCGINAVLQAKHSDLYRTIQSSR